MESPKINGMTTQQPTAPRLLRRRSDDRVIGGVASGLGDYFNVDPLLIRIGFVGLMVFGGMGIFLYLAAWLLVPEESSDRSILQRWIGRPGLGGTLIAVVLILVGISVVFGVGVEVAGQSDGFGAAGIALLVIVAGALILRRGEPDAAEVAEPGTDAGTAATATQPRVVVRRPARPPSPLGWYTIGGLLVAIGLLAVATNVSGANPDPGQFLGLALGAIGVGLVVGTWWGHARLLILLGLLLLPFALAASLIRVPIEGGWGAHQFRPTTVDEVRDVYRLVGGEIELDLTRLEGGDEPIAITATVAMGQVLVLLPEDADIELDAAVGGGRLRILGDSQGGTRLQDRYVAEGDGPQFTLDLEAGLGSVRVETRETEGR